MSAHLDSPLCLFSQSQKLLLLLLLLKFGSDCLTWSGGGGGGGAAKNKKQRGNTWTHYHYQSRVPGPVGDGRCLIVADDSFRLVCHDCSASTPPALQTPSEDLRRPWESCSSFRWWGGVGVGPPASSIHSGFHLSTNGESSGVLDWAVCRILFIFLSRHLRMLLPAWLFRHNRCVNNLYICMSYSFISFQSFSLRCTRCYDCANLPPKEGLIKSICL